MTCCVLCVSLEVDCLSWGDKGWCKPAGQLRHLREFQKRVLISNQRFHSSASWWTGCCCGVTRQPWKRLLCCYADVQIGTCMLIISFQICFVRKTQYKRDMVKVQLYKSQHNKMQHITQDVQKSTVNQENRRPNTEASQNNNNMPPSHSLWCP